MNESGTTEMFEEIFKRKKRSIEKMLAYGFVMKNETGIYETDILGGAFRLSVFVAENGNVNTELLDVESGEPYVLYRTDASGIYVGKIRAAITAVLQDIVAVCYDTAVFKTSQAEMAIEYVCKKYGDEPEFLWAKFPDNAIWRRKDNRKWYGAILTVVGRKIGLETDEIVEIIDLRMRVEDKDKILAQEHYYPGWHMNKKSWYTLVLDSGISDDEIKLRIAESYALAKNALPLSARG